MICDNITGAEDELHCFECVSLYERGSSSLARGYRREMNFVAGPKMMKSHNCIPRQAA